MSSGPHLYDVPPDLHRRPWRVPARQAGRVSTAFPLSIVDENQATQHASSESKISDSAGEPSVQRHRARVWQLRADSTRGPAPCSPLTLRRVASVSRAEQADNTCQQLPDPPFVRRLQRSEQVHRVVPGLHAARSDVVESRPGSVSASHPPCLLSVRTPETLDGPSRAASEERHRQKGIVSCRLHLEIFPSARRDPQSASCRRPAEDARLTDPFTGCPCRMARTTSKVRKAWLECPAMTP